MIKVVCFDFYNTLATHDPPREEAYVNACREYGIEVEPRALFTSLPAADMYWRNEISRQPLAQRSNEEKTAFYAEYAARIFQGAGVDISRGIALQILSKLQQVKWKFKAYDDSLPTLSRLKELGLTLGLISNVVQDMDSTYAELGLQTYLDFKVTSSEVGHDKPSPEIFLAALEKAKAKPEEAVHVGDQYELDVVGARGVGMTALLLDRNNHFPDITDCPRIRGLDEVTRYI